jgi:hypothetical protein
MPRPKGQQVSAGQGSEPALAAAQHQCQQPLTVPPDMAQL